MNTDNMALSGETIDYGPCAFMDAYDPATVFSSIDRGGRYAYGNQPPVAQWNLARLAEAMLPLLGTDMDGAVERATASLDRFPDLFERHWLDGMRAKLGLFTREPDDRALVDDLLAWMQRFRMLTASSLAEETARADAELSDWQRRWHARLERQPQSRTEAEELMRRHNPAVIPRNHKVEEALDAATAASDFSVMERLLDALATPYDHDRDLAAFTTPGDRGSSYRTFCGT
jgi:serine/tyrosine/threonine adenylyltransferase